MLCALCVSMFQNPSLKGPHHKDLQSLGKAADAGCRVCLYLMKVRAQRGPDEENESGHEPMLRYKVDHRWGDNDHYKDRWELSFGTSKPLWVKGFGSGRPPGICIHVCEDHDAPPDYHDFLTQAGRDLVKEPWRVRNTSTWRTVPDSSGDEQVATTARGWLERCRSSHVSCLPAAEHRDEHWHPRRLVRVQNETFGWRLVLREELEGQTISYASLSHCWGPTPSFLMLTSENLQALRQGMMDEDLPRSFLDAVVTVRCLGIEYIWIDSLCILQSGDGSEIDWLDNAAEMASVYSNSELNISIDHASCPSGGAFVKRDPVFFQPCHVWSHVLTTTCPPSQSVNQTPTEYDSDEAPVEYDSDEAPMEYDLDEAPMEYDLDEAPMEYDLNEATWPTKKQELARRHDGERVTTDSVPRLCTIFTRLDLRFMLLDLPLIKRAWVYQERLMSPRVLHFTADRIAWECRESEWLTEYLPEGVPCGRCHFDPYYSFEFDIDSRIEKLQSQSRETKVDQQREIQSAWWKTIKDYTSCELSHPRKDKLLAFAAVAKKWTSVLKSEYCAGMFRSDLPDGLLWYAVPFRYRHKPIQYRAPSWSWASMDGEMEKLEVYNKPDFVYPLDLLDIDVTLRDPHEPYGQVEAGKLAISGVVLPWFSDGDLPDTLPQPRATSDGGPPSYLWEFNFHHSIFDQEVEFTFDDPFYRPSMREMLRLLPIRETREDGFGARSGTFLLGLILEKVGDGLAARVGRFETNKEGTKPMFDNMELRERIDIV